MISAFILDFDGLILDTETPLIDAWVAAHAAHGRTFARERGHSVIGHHGVAFDPWEGIPDHIDRAQLEAEFVARKNEIIRPQPILPGVESLLDYARDHRIALAVASNSFHNHVDGHLQRLGLWSRFQTIICRDDVPHPKPAPDVYLAACAALGVSPGEAVGFEDSVPGHVAAFTAGLPVVVVPNPSTSHCTFAHASLQLTSLDEFSPAQLAAQLNRIHAVEG
ncbi:MAG: HAD family phosphatase [Candidatus Synoicihabitans palmerolidicus]|nr:HAD family phosphatase [Candidatus Synoicihabitans palmerolidicus]